MDTNTLATTLGTVAQVSAALAALIGFLGLWKLDWLRREEEELKQHLRQLVAYRHDVGDFLTSLQNAEEVMNYPWHEIERIARSIVRSRKEAEITGLTVVFDPRGTRIEAALARLSDLPKETWWLNRWLGGFLCFALTILGAAFWALTNVPILIESAWVSRVIVAASLVLTLGTASMVAEAGGWIHQDRTRVLTGMGISVGILTVWAVCGFWMAIAQDVDATHGNSR